MTREIFIVRHLWDNSNAFHCEVTRRVEEKQFFRWKTIEEKSFPYATLEYTMKMIPELARDRFYTIYVDSKI
jgi:hypothetical protein